MAITSCLICLSGRGKGRVGQFPIYRRVNSSLSNEVAQEAYVAPLRTLAFATLLRMLRAI